MITNMQKKQSAWDASWVLTFFAAFEPDKAAIQRMRDAFVGMAQEISNTFSKRYQNWHASLHCRSGFACLWLRFKAEPKDKAGLLADFETYLVSKAKQFNFRLGGVCAQTEAQTFGEGDPRQGNDVFSSVRGEAGMPNLWKQVQTATEWAAEDIAAGTMRTLPANWHRWVCHIYRNLLGLE